MAGPDPVALGRQHAAESWETPLPLPDQRRWAEIQQAAVICNRQAPGQHTSFHARHSPSTLPVSCHIPPLPADNKADTFGLEASQRRA